MANQEQITSMLSSMNLGDGNDSTELGSGSESGSGSGSVSGSGSDAGSGSDDSTDSVHSEYTAACVMIQCQASSAFNDGKRAAIPNANQNPITTLYNSPLSILLTHFNSGWNEGVETAGPLPTVEFDEVVRFVYKAAYDTGLMFESLYDNSPRDLPTTEAETLFRAWSVAGFYAGRHMMEKYRYETHLELVDFSDFFTNRRF